MAPRLSQLGDVGWDPQTFEAVSRLAAIVASSQDAIIGKTIAGIITSWSAGAEQIYGYSADEIIGHNVSELIPQDRVEEMEAVIARVEGGESVRHFETQRVTKDGRILDMSVAISPIRDAAGDITGAETVARDITGITRATVSRQVLEAQLDRVQRMESFSQLAGGVATDLCSAHRDLGSDLTPRELEVLGLMAGGLINKQVARRLGLRLNTVRNHSQSILCKLHAHSRLEAVATAVRDGIIAYPTSIAAS